MFYNSKQSCFLIDTTKFELVVRRNSPPNEVLMPEDEELLRFIQSDRSKVLKNLKFLNKCEPNLILSFL